MFKRLWNWLTCQDKINLAFQDGLDIGMQAGKFIADYATKVIPFHQKVEYYQRGVKFGKKIGHEQGLAEGIQIGMEANEMLHQMINMINTGLRTGEVIIPTIQQVHDEVVIPTMTVEEEVVQQNKVARVGVFTQEDMEALQNGDSSVLRIIRSGGRK